MGRFGRALRGVLPPRYGALWHALRGALARATARFGRVRRAAPVRGRSILWLRIARSGCSTHGPAGRHSRGSSGIQSDAGSERGKPTPRRGWCLRNGCNARAARSAGNALKTHNRDSRGSSDNALDRRKTRKTCMRCTLCSLHMWRRDALSPPLAAAFRSGCVPPPTASTAAAMRAASARLAQILPPSTR
jgi:hypothetical protein